MSSPTSSLSPPHLPPLPSSSSFSSRHASPPVSSSRLPLAPPCPPGPSRSLSDPLMKRQWQPLVAAPLTHVDSRSSAGKLTAVGDVREELERDLSSTPTPQLLPLVLFWFSCTGLTIAIAIAIEMEFGAWDRVRTLYVTSERAGSPDKTTRARGKKGWGGSIVSSAVSGAVSGAVTAGVYGAALGLTAYRLWSSRGDPISGNSDPDSNTATAATAIIVETIAPALAREVSPSRNTKPAETIGSPVSSKGTLSEEPPPPAYEESFAPPTGAGTGAGRVGEADEWVDMDDQRVNSNSNPPHTPTPRHSRSHHHLTSHPRSSLSTQHQKSQQHLRSQSHSHAPTPGSQSFHPAHANLPTRSPSHLASHTHAHTHAIIPVSPHKTSLPRSSTKHRSRSSWTSARSGSIASFEIIPPASTNIALGLDGLPSHPDLPFPTSAAQNHVPTRPGREANDNFARIAPNGDHNPEKQDIGEDDDHSGTAVMDRLDEMSARVQSLILEGQRALAEHPTAELLPGRWEDVRAPSTPTKAGSRRGTGTGAGASSGAGAGAGAGPSKVGSSGKMAIVRNRTSVSSLARDR